MRLVPIIFLLFLISTNVVARNDDPDSLLVSASDLLYEDPTSAIRLVSPVLITGDENQVFKACSILGDCNYLLGKFDLSLSYYQKCLQLGEAQGDESKIGEAYLGIGTVYSENGNADLAMDYYFKALDIRETQNDKVAISNVLNNIAVLFHKEGKHKKAISYMYEVSAIDRELKDSISMGFSYSNLGSFYYFENKNDSALFYHNKALEIRTAIGANFQRSRSLNNIANVLVEMGQMEQAVEVYQKAITIRRSLNNQHELALGLNNLGESLMHAGREREAFPYLVEANEILDSLDAKSMLLDNSYYLAKSYAEQRQFDKAYRMLLRTYKLRVELFDESKSLQTQEMMAKFETQQTEKENEELRAKRAEDSLDLEKSKNRNYLLIGGMSILALLAIMIFGKFYLNKKNTSVLRNLYDQLEEKNGNILDSIVYAKRIQKAILPPSDKIKSKLPNSFVYYVPKDVVAGDFYWLKSIGQKTLFAVADCTGHGVPGALVSVVCNNALNRSVHEHKLSSPVEILHKTREIVEDEFGQSDEGIKDGMDIALCCLDGLKLTYSGANNPLWVVRKGTFDYPETDRLRYLTEGEYTLLEIRGDKQPVGKYAFGRDFTEHAIELKPDDTIYIFSDGYMDQFGGDEGKKFKSGNFRKLILKAQAHDMNEQEGFVDGVFQDWKGKLEQLDDICVIGVRI